MGLNPPAYSMRPEISFRSEPWYSAYMSALFENDAASAAQRIALAERLIDARERELFQLRTAGPELRALNSALLALRALAICRKILPSSRQADAGLERVRPGREPVAGNVSQAPQPERGSRG